MKLFMHVYQRFSKEIMHLIASIQVLSHLKIFIPTTFEFKVRCQAPSIP